VSSSIEHRATINKKAFSAPTTYLLFALTSHVHSQICDQALVGWGEGYLLPALGLGLEKKL